MGIEALRGSSTAVQSGTRIYMLDDPDLDASADNNTATATMTAPTDGSRWVIGGWITSFSADPAAAKAVTVTLNGQSFSYDITKGGPAPVFFPVPLTMPSNVGGSVSLAASGTGGTVGKVKLFAFKERPVGES